jgi:excisionase family DNA binding protein
MTDAFCYTAATGEAGASLLTQVQLAQGANWMAKTLSTFAIAKMLYVDPGSVANWIDQGMLPAHRTPGGHRRVVTADLVRFLREHKMPVPEELAATPTRVLVVDDDPAIADFVARAIRSAHPDYDVLQAHDGFSAGTIIAYQTPDAVILDLRMPGMDGYEVCRLIKSQKSTRHIGIIAMTAYPSAEAEKSILECGAEAYLTKPLEMDALLRHIEDLL